MTPLRLTTRQKDILSFLSKYYESRRYAPSVEEIALECKCNPDTVRYNLSILMLHGYLIYEGHRRITLLWKL